MKKVFLLLSIFSLCVLQISAEKPSDHLPQKELSSQDTSHTTPAEQKVTTSSSLNIREVFFASPIIYSALLLMSMAAVVIWLYSFLTLRFKEVIHVKTIKDIKQQIIANNYQDALQTCHNNKTYLSQIIIAGITSRHQGAQTTTENMKSEGKRITEHQWQKISLLNDIVIIAPMLGLLGTVIGMFYAFYDINRTAESLSALFDGLGIAVGTTVAGLIVAILSMIFSSTLKFRLVKTLNHLEKEALAIGNLIQDK